MAIMLRHNVPSLIRYKANGIYIYLSGMDCGNVELHFLADMREVYYDVGVPCAGCAGELICPIV